MENFDIIALIKPVIEAIKGIDWDQVMVTLQTVVDKAEPFLKTITQFITDNVTPVA